MIAPGVVLEGYHYRTSARFGGRVGVSVDAETVTITGPRVGVGIYRLWIAAQVILLYAILPALGAAVVLWNWRYLALALGLLVAHWAVGTFGAVSLWELENVNAFTQGTRGETMTFPVGTVKRVEIGRAWARKGLRWVIPHFAVAVDQWATETCVSFEAPDGATGRDAVYALQMQSAEDARTLARLLGAGRQD